MNFVSCIFNRCCVTRVCSIWNALCIKFYGKKHFTVFIDSDRHNYVEHWITKINLVQQITKVEWHLQLMFSTNKNSLWAIPKNEKKMQRVLRKFSNGICLLCLKEQVFLASLFQVKFHDFSAYFFGVRIFSSSWIPLMGAPNVTIKNI